MCSYDFKLCASDVLLAAGRILTDGQDGISEGSVASEQGDDNEAYFRYFNPVLP